MADYPESYAEYSEKRARFIITRFATYLFGIGYYSVGI